MDHDSDEYVELAKAESVILRASNDYRNKLSTDELVAMDKTRAVLARLRRDDT